jgi:hypothetical protein
MVLEQFSYFVVRRIYQFNKINGLEVSRDRLLGAWEQAPWSLRTGSLNGPPSRQIRHLAKRFRKKTEQINGRFRIGTAKRLGARHKWNPAGQSTWIGWIELAAEPQLTAIAIVGRLSEKHPDQFGTKQHSIVQRLLKALRKKVAESSADTVEVSTEPVIRIRPPVANSISTVPTCSGDGAGNGRAAAAGTGATATREMRWQGEARLLGRHGPLPAVQASGRLQVPLAARTGRRDAFVCGTVERSSRRPRLEAHAHAEGDAAASCAVTCDQLNHPHPNKVRRIPARMCSARRVSTTNDSLPNDLETHLQQSDFQVIDLQ